MRIFQKKKSKTQKINQRLNNAVEGIKNTTVGGSVCSQRQQKAVVTFEKLDRLGKRFDVVFTILSED